MTCALQTDSSACDWVSHANINPVNGGIVYGDYMYTHNISPEMWPNDPVVPQVGFARAVLLDLQVDHSMLIVFDLMRAGDG